MTYLAPRQGLFATIILISFSLQTLLLVLSTEQQLEKSQAQKGEQMVTQLINESSFALQNRDRVSLSVIAGRYTSEQDVARLVIKDANDEVLVPLGNAPMHQGKTIRQIATKGDAVIGSVALTLKDTSKGEIIASQWPFVIGSLLLHLFLWLLYGYVARPTKAQINALSRDIHEHYRQQYKPTTQMGRTAHEDPSLVQTSGADDVSTDGAAHKRWSLFGRHHEDTGATPDYNAAQAAQSDNTLAKPSATDIHNELNAYVQSQQDDKSLDISADDLLTSASEERAFNKQATANSTDVSAQDNQAHSTVSASVLSANRHIDTVDVQIVYDDNYRLLDKLAPETADPYFTLCSQLLNQAVTELLKQPLLHGVSLLNQPKFDHSGAVVVLKADNDHSKVALAGVMLGKLYLMLNQIIYDKHRELSRFALPIRIGVSDDKQARPLSNLLTTVGRRGEMLILFPKSGLKQIGNHVQLRSLPRPTTVYERESAFFDGTNEAMMQRLIDVRNAVLLSGNEA
ncbi:hypothetical protein [Psychrobacter pygoscelis]|uniref:hypothetical protein n=1 Tax=Psychrobacter pygoscelis TaxID=2488563 RepID=UPI00103D0AE3|nr:hypothetical protein [Psychrobacter pygoscelis]